MSDALQLVPFEAGHALEIMRGGIIENSIKVTDQTEQMKEIAKRYEAYGMSWSICDDEGPILSILTRPMWPGVVEVIAVFSERFAEHTVEGCKITIKLLDESFKMYNLHRVQAFVRTDFPVGQRFLEWLGFEREGVARQHSFDKVDSIYYAKVK